MADEYLVNSIDMTAVADAIREKSGMSDALIFPGGFADAIAAIPTGGLAYDMGEFTLDADAVNQNIPHGLGTVPDFILVWTDAFAESGTNTTDVNVSMGMLYFKNIFGLPQYLTSTARAKIPHNYYATISAGGTSTNYGGGTSSAYGMQEEPTNETFQLSKCGNVNNKWRAGITYKYFVSEKWW